MSRSAFSSLDIYSSSAGRLEWLLILARRNRLPKFWKGQAPSNPIFLSAPIRRVVEGKKGIKRRTRAGRKLNSILRALCLHVGFISWTQHNGHRVLLKTIKVYLKSFWDHTPRYSEFYSALSGLLRRGISLWHYKQIHKSRFWSLCKWFYRLLKEKCITYFVLGKPQKGGSYRSLAGTPGENSCPSRSVGPCS